MTNLCDDEGSQNCPTAHVFIVSVARVPEEIKDEIKTLQDCGDLEPAYRDAASLRLMDLWDELERLRGERTWKHFSGPAS
jgi:hypothetical protein